MTAVGHQLEVLAELARRDVRLRYRGTVLGLGWAQLAPLAQLAVMTVVFTRIVPVDVDHYPAYLLVGLLAWQWWSAGLAAATTSVLPCTVEVRRDGAVVGTVRLGPRVERTRREVAEAIVRDLPSAALL